MRGYRSHTCPVSVTFPIIHTGVGMRNALFFGDNLEVLRESIKDESVDLVYLDPPFNSNATYNVLFKSPKGHGSESQIEAFDDTWHWGEHAEAAFADLMHQSNTDVAEVVRALRSVLGDNDMMAYLAMMAIRLIELHRVLKPTGSLYLHCDSTAADYLKIVLDQVFGFQNYRNHIVWQRSDAHNDAKLKYPAIADHIFFYSKAEPFTFNKQYRPHAEKTLREWYQYLDLADGTTRRMTKQEVESQTIPMGARRFNTADMSAPAGGGMAAINSKTGKSNGWYPYKGFQPPERGWRYSPETMAELDAKGLLLFPDSPTKRIMLKRYLDEQAGVTVGDIWNDIDHIRANTGEGLGYPTQKPLALLERIINASSNEGDVILDPFCGCGTAVHAAEKLKRKWIGIDVTHLAVSLIEKRMRDAFPGIEFDVHGTPKDFDGARNLAERDKYQFQWWACSLVNAQPYQGKKKGADSGIDGIIYFQDDNKTPKKIVVSVKGGESVSVAMLRDLGHVIDREKAVMGFFVSLVSPTKPMVTEAAGMGFYTSPLTGANFPKMQILTIEGLLAGTEQARYPRMDAGGLTFKKAKREEAAPDQRGLF